MNLYLQLGLAGAVGCLMGWLYFRGLWETLQRLPRQRHPALWMLGSLLLRMAIVLAGFALLARWGSWPAVLAALAGMLLVRLALQRRLGAARPEATR